MRRPMPAVSQGRTDTFTEHRPSDGLSDNLRSGGAPFPRCHVFARLRSRPRRAGIALWRIYPPQHSEYCCAFQRHYAILTINHAIIRVGTIDDGAIGMAAWQRIAPRRDRANRSRGARGPPRPPLFRRVGRPPPYTLPAQIT